MNSKRRLFKAITVVLLAAGFIQGCGLFGRKADLKRFLELTQGNTGCLNKANEKIEAFLKGTVSPAEWNGLWNCAIDTLDLFTTFVRGSSDQGFTQDDIQSMVSMVLLTDKPVTKEFIDAHFAIKASILGGSRSVIAGVEMQRLVQFLRFAQRATTTMIPHLAKINQVPTPTDLLNFADAFGHEADGLARLFEQLGVSQFQPYERESAAMWLDEIKKLYGWEFSNQFLGVVFTGKQLLAAGDADVVEGANWPKLVSAIGRFGGLAAAYSYVDKRVMSGPNAYGEFLVQLIRRAKEVLRESIVSQNGRIPYEAFDRLVDALPSNWLTMDRTIVKAALRPTFTRILEAQSQEGLDWAALENLVSLADQWRRGKTHLDTIFEQYQLSPAGVLTETFATAAEQYKANVSSEDVSVVDRLIGLARKFLPLYLGDDKQISFTGDLKTRRNSRNNLTQLHFSNFLIQHVLRVYSKDFANRPDKGSKEEFLEFWSDFKPMLGELKMLDPTVINSGARRFTEADVFLLNSNGDGFMSVDEGTYYLPYLASIGVLTDRFAYATIDECRRPEWGKDFYGWDWMEIDCYRNSYYRQYRTLWDFFPELTSEYERMGQSEIARFKTDIEGGARRYGISDCPIGVYDAQGYAGIIYYIESMFARFDKNKSGRMGTQDVLDAFPVFRGKIAEIAGLDPVKDNSLLRAIFTYLIHYGHPPADGFWGSVDLIRWKLLKPFWSIKAYRKDVYKIVTLFSTPEVSPNCGRPVDNP